MDHDQQEAVALHRFGVIAEATNPRLTPAERGAVVRAIAARAHSHPDGTERRYSRGTIDRWVRAWRAGGLDALRPRRGPTPARCGRIPSCSPRRPRCAWSCPSRSAAQIASILYHRHGIRVAERTVRAQLRRAGLHREALAAEPKVFGRYEAETPNDRWITDVLVGPWVPWPRVDASVRARLFLIVDDHSRLIVDGRFFAHENARAGQELLRRAIVRRGVPVVLYADNGAPFANAWLARTCAVLGVRLVHSKPYSPEGRGKQERPTATSARRSWPRPPTSGIASLDELNDRFVAWAEQVANRRVHAETDETPIERFERSGPHRGVDADRLARGVPLVGHPQGDPHRHRPAGGQRLRRRPRPGRPAGRAALRPRGPHPHRRLPRRPARRRGHPVRHPPPRAPRRPPSRPARTGRHRHRLPRPGRRRPRRGGRHRAEDRLLPTRHVRRPTTTRQTR